MIFLLFILFIIALWVANAWHDSDYYNGRNEHTSGAVLACLAVLGLFMFELTGIKTSDFNDVINISFLLLSLRWIVFDISYNLFIGQKWYYKGTTSIIDRLPTFIFWSGKIACLFFDSLIITSYINSL